MGKKKDQSASLGRRIIKSRFGKNVNRSGDSFLHTSELPDGYDWGRLNLQSVTEQSNLDEFLATAELAGTEFAAEKMNISFVDPGKNGGLLTADELGEVKDAQRKHRQLLRIPRRPPWSTAMTPDELDGHERQTFLEWRRGLSELQDMKHILMTPYEKNLDFWRQLWRVIERSDIVVQIVDARNPLLFRCVDLEKYVKEVDPGKVNLVLINKADYLTDEQRELWAEYFSKAGVLVAFWSALAETNNQEQNSADLLTTETRDDTESYDEESDDDNDDDNGDDEDDDESDNGGNNNDKAGDKTETAKLQERLRRSGDMTKVMPTGDNAVLASASLEADDVKRIRLSEPKDETETIPCDAGMPDSDKVTQSDSMFTSRTTEQTTASDCSDKNSTEFISACKPVCSTSAQNSDRVSNSSKVLGGEELLELFRTLHTTTKVNSSYTTIGMVGYPNVGKSSTINAILKMKKVPVSATPGRTKHFQTLYVDQGLMLCDCPGLVFPSFVTTKADLVANGILPIDQMRDHVPPVSLVCQHIPRSILERMYGVNLPQPGEFEDPLRSPTSAELLNAYGAMRGFMTSRGVPDNPRASRYILKDYVKGKLLFCHPPPSVDEASFQSGSAEASRIVKGSLSYMANEDGLLGSAEQPEAPVVESKIDKDFFKKTEPRVHSKGIHGVAGFTRATHSGQHISTEIGTSPGSSHSLTEKPWKKHNNRKKKKVPTATLR